MYNTRAYSPQLSL